MRGEELHLTPIEYKLLCLLSRNVGKVLTTYLYYTTDYGEDLQKMMLHLLEVFHGNFALKNLESDKNEIQYIQTHIGIGYRMLRIE